MKRLGILSVAATAVLCMSARAFAQEVASPGPEHKMLAEMAGSWECTITMAGVPGESKGTSESKMELGGLWLVTEFSGDFGGLPFQGRGLDGYDTAKKKYIGVWVDSMTTSPLVMEGDYDQEKKTLTTTGKGPGPEGKPVGYKAVTAHPDKDHQTFTLYLVGDDGQETSMMTIEYVRKK